ncbi:MAG: hypothetical protein NWF00_04840 [Candidatus Bathyarchaeota archaeon]|nr:hypothetical protein [Candidatus Bathyarchaeota archaeon]
MVEGQECGGKLVCERVASLLPFRVLEAAEGRPLRISGVALAAGLSRNLNVYTVEELQAFAGKLVGAPMYIEHVAVPNAAGKVTKAFFDSASRCLMYEAEVYDPAIAEKIRQGLIQHVSVGADYDAVDLLNARAPHGLHNAEISLVAVPGVPEANIQVLERLGESFVLGRRLQLSAKAREVLEPLGPEFLRCVFCGHPGEYLVTVCTSCGDKADAVVNARTSEQLEPEMPGEYFLGFVQDSALFLPEHFKIVWIDQANGVLAVMAKTRVDPAVERCQSLFFLKSKWQPNTIADWLRMHPDYEVSATGAGGIQSNGVESLNEKELEELIKKKVAEALKVSDQGSPKTDDERAKTHFNLTDEQWDVLSEEEKQNYISKLPPVGTGRQNVVTEAEWDAEYINSLPDEAFAYIEDAGQKDDQGKTVPRSLRHLPYKNAEGNLDADHVRNALARLDQTEISAEAKTLAMKKLCTAAGELGIESAVCNLDKTAESLQNKLTEAEGKLTETQSKLNDANKTVEQLKQLVPGVDLLNDPPKMMPVSEHLTVLEGLLPAPIVENSTLGMKRECQVIRSAILKAKGRL